MKAKRSAPCSWQRKEGGGQRSERGEKRTGWREGAHDSLARRGACDRPRAHRGLAGRADDGPQQRHGLFLGRVEGEEGVGVWAKMVGATRAA